MKSVAYAGGKHKFPTLYKTKQVNIYPILLLFREVLGSVSEFGLNVPNYA